MIKRVQILAFFGMFLITSITCSALDVSVTHASYQAESQSYTEFFIHVVGNTLAYDSLDSGIKARVKVTYILSQNDSVISADRFAMNSPIFESPTDFVQMMRKSIPAGTYEASFEFQDEFDPSNDYKVIIPIVIPVVQNQISISDIRLLASFKQSEEEGNLNKHGFYFEPLPYNLYHKNSKELSVYCEIYDFQKTLMDDYAVVYGIQDEDENGDLVYINKRAKRFTPGSVQILLARLDITDLESGNYLFVVEAINRSGEVIHRRELPFMRSNPQKDLEMVISESEIDHASYLENFTDDSLDYYLKALVPIVSNQDVDVINFLLDKGKTKNKMTFIDRYFDQNYPQNPSKSFYQYAEIARAIDRMYNDGFGYGFESDRGRIYLKYGRPSQSINVQDDEGAFPYEIWYYDQMPTTNQRDVRFLFYNPDYTSNRYRLLTSTCRQEKQLRQWELELYRNAPGDITDNRVDATRVSPDYRRRARELYTQ